jgi:hypothetical protein
LVLKLLISWLISRDFPKNKSVPAALREYDVPDVAQFKSGKKTFDLGKLFFVHHPESF